MNKASQFPCPICKKVTSIIGKINNKKLLGCGCKISFKKTRSQKEMDRKYIKTSWGYELK